MVKQSRFFDGNVKFMNVFLSADDIAGICNQLDVWQDSLSNLVEFCHAHAYTFKLKPADEGLTWTASIYVGLSDDKYYGYLLQAKADSPELAVIALEAKLEIIGNGDWSNFLAVPKAALHNIS